MLEEKTRTEKATEPAKRWRNWYWLSNAQQLDDGRTIGPGRWEHGDFTSEDAAKKSAAEWRARIDSRQFVVQATIIYLGAYPEGQKP